MATLEEKLDLIEQGIVEALRAVQGEPGASPVLLAVVQEFDRKSKKARQVAALGEAALVREAVVEVEQAADSAKVAAHADPGASPSTRRAVDIAHDAICLLKREG